MPREGASPQTRPHTGGRDRSCLSPRASSRSQGRWTLPGCCPHSFETRFWSWLVQSDHRHTLYIDLLSSNRWAMHRCHDGTVSIRDTARNYGATILQNSLMASVTLLVFPLNRYLAATSFSDARPLRLWIPMRVGPGFCIHEVCSSLSGDSCAGTRVWWARTGWKGEKTALSATLQCSLWVLNEWKENYPSSSHIPQQNPTASPPRGLISRHQGNRGTGQYLVILIAPLLQNAQDLRLLRGTGADLLQH